MLQLFAMKKTIIVIPTYNEASNVEPLIRAIFQNAPGVYVMIVDDNSPDGTGKIVSELKKTFPNLMLFERAEKQGLGMAYKAGFRRALELHPDTEFLGMMDADFYHDPKDLPKLIAASDNYDLVIGSVYAPGGKVPDSFTLKRRALSRGGNLYCWAFFGYPLTDWTNAFAIIRVSALKKIDMNRLAAREFAFVSGIKYALLKGGATWKDVGVVANERTAGQSKITSKTIIEALKVPWKLRFGKNRI